MIRLRKAADRGHADHGWLRSHHSFSFADYYDPAHMGFRTLRVVNEDYVEPSRGFGTHSHRDMEIVTWVLEGALEHKDSMGNGSVILPGDAQLMRAGTGVTHSEFNNSPSELVHLLQIWILPARAGLKPAYAQQHFDRESRRNTLRRIVSPGGDDGALLIEQDASIYASLADAGTSLRHDFAPGRHGWLQLASGSLRVNGTTLEAGDGAAISEERAITIEAAKDSELLLFDLA